VLARESNETKTNLASAMNKEINSTRAANRGVALEREKLKHKIDQTKNKKSQCFMVPLG
jgi:hypothetical protein